MFNEFAPDDITEMTGMLEPYVITDLTYGGWCPFQAEGRIAGHRFYFRLRHSTASLNIAVGEQDPISDYCWSAEQTWLGGDGMFDTATEFAHVFGLLYKALKLSREFIFEVHPETVAATPYGVIRPHSCNHWKVLPWDWVMEGRSPEESENTITVVYVTAANIEDALSMLTEPPICRLSSWRQGSSVVYAETLEVAQKLLPDWDVSKWNIKHSTGDDLPVLPPVAEPPPWTPAPQERSIRHWT